MEEAAEYIVGAQGRGWKPRSNEMVQTLPSRPAQPPLSRQRPCAPAQWPTCTGRKLPTTLTEGPCTESAPGSVCPLVQQRPHTMTREILLWIPFGQNLHPFSPNTNK